MRINVASKLWLRRTTHRGAETFLELVNATFRVNELLLSGEEGVGIRGDAHRDHGVFHAVDDFFAIG